MRTSEFYCKDLTLKPQMNRKIKVSVKRNFIKQNVLNVIMIADENEATTSFLMQLSTWDKEELDDKLANRVQVSKRAVAKVIQAFDRLMQRNEKITLALKGELEGSRFFIYYNFTVFHFHEPFCSGSSKHR